jgi:hypothetical protein
MHYTDGDVRLYRPGMDADFVVKCEAVLADCRGQGYPLYVVEGYRTKARQLYLFLCGKTRLKYPVYHGHGVAMDCAFVVNGRLTYAVRQAWWDAYGSACAAHGLEWGGDWSGSWCDRPHCQWVE